MMPEIPEYYRKLAERSSQDVDADATAHTGSRSAGVRSRADMPAAPEVPYVADSFTMQLYDGWQDKSVFVIGGPVTDGIQHNITVSVGTGENAGSLIEFADIQIRAVEDTLQGCSLLKTDDVQLHCGLPARRAIFVWYPTEELRLYQEQFYVLHEVRAFTLTASFTKKTRKTLGPGVEQIMLSFEPVQASDRRRTSDTQRRR